MIDEFSQSWATVNVFLSPAEMLITTGPNLPAREHSDLAGLKAAYESLMSQVQGFKNDLEIAQGEAATVREALAPLITAFNRKVRGSLGHTSFPNALPPAVSVTMGNAAILRSGDDMINLWGKINALAATGAFTPPLVVQVNQPGTSAMASITLVLATARVAALRTALQGTGGAGGTANAEQNLQLKRADRDRLWEKEIRPLLSAYRDRIIGDYPPDHPLVLSLPRLYVPDTGTTPDPVTASVQWVAPPGEAVITHSATTNEEVVRYELRATPGLEWVADTASVIATRLVSAPGPLEFHTTWNLTASGNSIAMKVYVVTGDGHERGSETLTVTRP